jgi:hypothetical protein
MAKKFGSLGVMLISFSNVFPEIPGLYSWLGAIAESQEGSRQEIIELMGFPSRRCLNGISF